MPLSDHVSQDTVYPGTHLNEDRFNVRYEVVAAYLHGRTKDQVILDLNCGQAQLSHYISDAAAYHANDLYQTPSTKGIHFMQCDDTEVNLACDILICLGYGAGDYTGNLWESATIGHSIVRLANHQPQYIVIEMSQKWEEEYGVESWLTEQLPDYAIDFQSQFTIPPDEHYHDRRQLVVYRRKPEE
jgi:hypothetical protein